MMNRHQDRFIVSALPDRRTTDVPLMGLLVLCLLLLAGCAAPTGIQFATADGDALKTESILVATGRAADSDVGDFSGERGKAITFADYQVSIPATHKVGQIEWPRASLDPKLHFAVTTERSFKASTDFRQQLDAQLSDPRLHAADGKREVVLFIHGYNTDFSEGLYRAAQMKHDFALNLPIMLFSWPSAGKTGLYLYDRDSVKTSRDQLAQVIELLEASSAQRITLVAHSMGSELLMETLRQFALSRKGALPAKIRTVILISPDVDIDVFNSQLNGIKALPPEFAVFVSQNDRALALSSLLAGDSYRVGNNIDTSKIQRGGIQVIDVSSFSGGDSLNHMTAVTSPSLVAMLKGMRGTEQSDLFGAPGQQVSLTDQVVGAATLPLTLVVKTTKAILDE